MHVRFYYIVNILTIYENDISIENMGKGKENMIKTETALDKDANRSDIILIEEPERQKELQQKENEKYESKR